MPRRKFTITHDVIHARGAGPSGRALARELRSRGYDGPMINWGVACLSDDPASPTINSYGAVRNASNKRVALQIMRAAGVPVPMVMSPQHANSLMDEQGGLPEWPNAKQVIGRTDRHRAGSGLWFCTTKFQVNDAAQAGATHFVEFIGGDSVREFRCHVLFGQSHKLTEKVWRGEGEPSGVTRTHGTGWVQLAPRPQAGKARVRQAAKDAVLALGLDFGAVDVITRRSAESELEVFVLEVNTAPRLTDPSSDTLDRYASAFLGRPT